MNNWVDKLSQGCSKIADDEMEVWIWLRQHSKDFYAAGSNAVVMRQDRFISIGGYVEN
jgi:hypothetical protein